MRPIFRSIGIAPRPADVVGPHHVVRAVRPDPREVDVVAPLVLDEIRGPDRADVLAQRRADRRPVHQVARLPDDQPRIGVERRERHVVVVAVLQHRRVGVIAGEDRVEEGAIAQVGLALALDAAGPARLTIYRRSARGGGRRHRRQPAAGPHPFEPSQRPRRGRPEVGAEAEAVLALLVDVQFRRHPGRAQRPVQRQTVFERHAAICRRVDEERRRHRRRHLPIDRRPPDQRGARRLAQQVAARVAMDVRSVHLDDGVEQGEEVGPAAHRVERMPGASLGHVEERAGHPGEVSAGRGTENADSIRFDAELDGPRADDPYRPQHVLQRRREPVIRDAVLEDERRHALGPQSLGRAGRFVGHGQPRVRAAWGDDDGRAGRRAGRGQVGQAGVVDVADPSVGPALLAAIGQPSGHAFGPERNRLHRLGPDPQPPQPALEVRDAVEAHAQRGGPLAERREHDVAAALAHAVHGVGHGAAVVDQRRGVPCVGRVGLRAIEQRQPRRRRAQEGVERPAAVGLHTQFDQRTVLRGAGLLRVDEALLFGAASRRPELDFEGEARQPLDRVGGDDQPVVHAVEFHHGAAGLLDDTRSAHHRHRVAADTREVVDAPFDRRADGAHGVRLPDDRRGQRRDAGGSDQSGLEWCGLEAQGPRSCMAVLQSRPQAERKLGPTDMAALKRRPAPNRKPLEKCTGRRHGMPRARISTPMLRM